MHMSEILTKGNSSDLIYTNSETADSFPPKLKDSSIQVEHNI